MTMPSDNVRPIETASLDGVVDRQKIDRAVQTIKGQESGVAIGTIAYIKELLSNPLGEVERILEDTTSLSVYVLAAKLCEIKAVPKDKIVAGTIAGYRFLHDVYEAPEGEEDRVLEKSGQYFANI